jgi:hypothetical protein
VDFVSLKKPNCFMKYVFLLSICSVLFSSFGQKINQIDGYSSKIMGEVLRYFSPLHEFADSSLLTRCNGSSPIEMNGQISTGKGKTTQFRFLIGHSSGTSAANRHFNISLNGQSLFILETQQKRTGIFREEKQVNSNISYALQCIEYDINKDVFAWLYITVPTSWVTEKAHFQFKGADEQSRDWLMVFMQESTWKFQLEASNLILKNAKLRELNLRLQNPLYTESKVIRVDSRFFHKEFKVSPGYNHLSFAGYPMDFIGTDTVRITMENQKFQQIIQLQATKNYQFHIIHHSHNDIGYSHLQTEVERIQTKNIRDALSWISNNQASTVEAVWHIESLWAVENFLRNATETETQNFIKTVKAGNIVLSANYANVLTGLSQREELNWLVEYAKQLEQTYGIHVSNAMITDIPGITHAGLENYTRNHIPYLSLGPNYVENLPDHGDRVGGVIKENGDRVFYWKASPDANEKLLVWTAGKGYSYFHNIQDNEKEAKWESRISAYVHQLESTNYPYDIVQLRYTKNADNGPVDTNLCQFVKAWNERYESPTLVLSNVDSLFAQFEQKYGNQIPVVTGEISPYWEDGAYSTAVEEMENRSLSVKTISMEAFAKKTKQFDQHAKEFYQLHRNIILFHEHTWGSWCSISDPELFFTTEQWRIKKSFLDSALQEYERLSKTLGFNAVSTSIAPTVTKSIITDFQVDLSTGGISKLIVQNEDLTAQDLPDDLMQFIYSKGIAPMEFYRPQNIQPSNEWEDENRKSIQLNMELEGVQNLVVQYSWMKNTNRISVHVAFDKNETLEKESMHMAFPFEHSNWQLGYGDNDKMLNYPADQLPGSNKEFICASQKVALCNGKRTISIQAPAFSLFEVGGLINEEKVNGAKVWTRSNAPVNPLYLYVLNNYWHTNYKASQGGHFSYDVYLDIE